MDLAERSRKSILGSIAELDRKRAMRLQLVRWLVLAAQVTLYLLLQSQPTRPSPVLGSLAGGFLGIYALVTVVTSLLGFTVGKNWKGFPPLCLTLDVLLLMLICWSTGNEIFALPYVPAMLLMVMSDLLWGALMVAVVAAGNLGYLLISNTRAEVSFNISIYDVVTLAVAMLLFAFSLFVVTAGRSGLLKSNIELIEEAIASTTNKNLMELQSRVKAVYRVASTLSATLDYQAVVRNILVEVDSVFGISAGAVLLFDGTMNSLRVADSIGLTEDEEKRPVETRFGVIRDTLKEAKPVLISDDSDMDDLWNIFSSMKNCHSGIVMPLRGGYEVFGLLIIASTKPDDYGENDMEMMVALTSHTIVAMQNATLYRNLLEDRNKMLTAEEEVRHTLARNLHDGPAQAVAAFSMQTEFIRRLMKSDLERASDELVGLGKQAQQTSKEIRTLLYELRPLVLESQGINSALEQYATRFPMHPNDPKVHFTRNNEIDGRLNPAVETTIFTILQEAVNNARKHAQSKNIWLRVEFREGFVVASAQDDGRGFDTGAVESTYDTRGSLGMTNMKERAALVGGTTRVLSRVGQGTSVVISIPLTQETLASPALRKG